MPVADVRVLCVCVFRGRVLRECTMELCVKQRLFDSRQAMTSSFIYIYTLCIIITVDVGRVRFPPVSVTVRLGGGYNDDST